MQEKANEDGEVDDLAVKDEGEISDDSECREREIVYNTSAIAHIPYPLRLSARTGNSA